MRLEITTGAYNERRYGKPWIAKVAFPTAKGEFAFGEWAGSDGRPGLLVIEAEPGDVIARGQKDFRKPANSSPDYYLVTDAGALEPIEKAEAYQHYQKRSMVAAAAPDRIALEAERERLLARLAELNTILEGE